MYAGDTLLKIKKAQPIEHDHRQRRWFFKMK